MSEALTVVAIPDRPSFRASEVCELLKVQPYVLRSWENEFKDLGAAKTPGGPRVYRRADVEMALRIRQLVFGEGLTLAGVRRRLEQERASREEAESDDAVALPAAAAASPETRHRLERAKQGLRGVIEMLSRGSVPHPAGPSPRSADEDRAAVFDLAPPSHDTASDAVAVASAGPARRSRKKKQ